MSITRALSQFVAALLLALLCAIDRLTGLSLPLGLGADYTLTAASVVASAGANKLSGVAGETLSAGMPIYRKAVDGLLYKADANDATKIPCIGVALNGASANQPLQYTDNDPAFTHGLATTAAGDVVVLSATAGGAAPAADIASGWYAQVIGVAISATQMVLRITAGTVAKA